MQQTETRWTLQHETQTQIQTEPKDSRGLLFAQSCGYEWVNKNDGQGWRQISMVVRELAFREMARAA
jgi:hypothetical protein